MANSHSWRNSVRVDNHVGIYSFYCERQVLLTVSHATRTFLAVSACELISNLRNLDLSHLNFNKSLVFLVCGYYNLIDVAFFWMLKGRWPVLVGFGLLLNVWDVCVRLKLIYGRCLSNDDVVSENLNSRTNYTISVEFVVSSMFPSWSLWGLWNSKSFICTFCILIRSKESRPKKATINCTLIYHDWVFLVVTRVCSDCDDWVASCGKFFKPYILHWLSGN